MSARYIVLVLFFLGSISFGDQSKKDNSDIYDKLQQVMETLEYINKSYVDQDKLKGDKLMYGAINGMISALDPHSHFMTPDDFKDLQSQTQGTYSGIGVEITIKNDILTIVAPFEKSPAWKKGIKAGDRILKVNGVLTKNMSMSDAIKKIKGPKGTTVKLTILHEGAEKTEDIDVERDDIKIQSVNSFIIGEKIGYIRLRQFIESSGKDIEKALLYFEKEKIKGLILDLRNDPGGLLNVSIDIANKFLPENKMIVSTKSRYEEKKYPSTGGNPYVVSLPMIVLINKGSASASEIVAGAMQDNKRALVIGSKSFGKASVQSIFPLTDGSGLRLTTAYYYTPSGKKIHEIGIIPDISIEEKEPSDAVWKMRYYEHFDNYAKKMKKEDPELNLNTAVDDKMIEDMIKDVRAKSFQITDAEVEKNRGFLKTFLKVEIVKVYKNEEEAEKTAAEEDEIVKRSLDFIKSIDVLNR
jgi:carboxyl-terminal processing protease